MSEWVEKSLGELAYLEIGGTPSRDNPVYWAEANGDGHPWVSIADLRAGRVAETSERITDLGVRHSNVKPIKRGTVLMTFKLTIGDVAIAESDLFTNEAIVALTPKSREITSAFLFHALPGAAKSAITDAAIKGATLNKDKLAKIVIRFPKEEAAQSSIARILRTLDTQIDATEGLIVKQQRVRAGLLQDLFTRGVDEHGQLRPPRNQAPHLYHQTELGWLPLGWEVVKLQKVADVQRGLFGARPRNDPRFYGGVYPFIQTSDVSKSSGRRIASHSQTLNQLGLATSRMFPAGTIAVTIAANIGDAAILSYPMCAPDSVVGVVPFQMRDGPFLQLVIGRKKGWLERRAPQTAQKNINLEDLRPLEIEFPGGEERIRIIEIMATSTASVEKLEFALTKLRLQRSGLMQDLLSGTVPVTPLLESAAT